MKLGFIGTGNMGGAIIRGYAAASAEHPRNVWVYNKTASKASKLAEETGVHFCLGTEEIAMNCDAVILGVKPYAVGDVVTQLLPMLNSGQILVSMAAGVSIGFLERTCAKHFEQNGKSFPVKIVRIMPNTPAAVGESMTSVSRNKNVTDEEMEGLLKVFGSIGRAEEVDENLIEAVIGVSGSSPAYVYLFIEALADGAVAEGMPREKAYTFAAQSVLGAAKMVLETGIHPGQLKDMVCSPGGTTIEAVRSLEKNGLRNTVMDAVHTAAEKSRSMSK